jgi:endonuclease/exonuclease/phosphatase (EEP) superfamily protein YafD
VLVLTWNLFHGRAKPAAGRPLLKEFADALAGWPWQVALLQEVPPWWPATLGDACRAAHVAVRTSRTEGLALRRAIGTRNPDLIASNGGGANAILVRGPAAVNERGLVEHRRLTLRRRPERRRAHATRLPGGGWVVNLHASLGPAAHGDVERARRAALEWAGDEPIVFGGDFNHTRPQLPGFEPAGHHYVDHVYVRGVRAAGAEVLDAGTLSDHRPLLVRIGG